MEPADVFTEPIEPNTERVVVEAPQVIGIHLYSCKKFVNELGTIRALTGASPAPTALTRSNVKIDTHSVYFK